MTAEGIGTYMMVAGCGVALVMAIKLLGIRRVVALFIVLVLVVFALGLKTLEQSRQATVVELEFVIPSEDWLHLNPVATAPAAPERPHTGALPNALIVEAPGPSAVGATNQPAAGEASVDVVKVAQVTGNPARVRRGAVVP